MSKKGKKAMPRNITLTAIYINKVVINRDLVDPTQVNDMQVHYSVVDAQGQAHGGGVYTQALTASQKTTLKNILATQALPAIQALEGI